MKWLKALLMVLAVTPAMAIAAEGKFAVLDVEGAIRASKQVNELRSQLQAQFADEQERLKTLAAEGNALKERAQKEADFLSEDERKALVLEIQQKFQAFQQLKNSVAQQMKEQEQLFLQQLRPKVEEILKVLVEKNEIDLIFNKRALVYTRPMLDVTPQVVEELNKQ